MVQPAWLNQPDKPDITNQIKHKQINEIKPTEWTQQDLTNKTNLTYSTQSTYI